MTKTPKSGRVQSQGQWGPGSVIVCGLVLLSLVGLWNANQVQAEPDADSAQLLYELRTYTTNPGRLPALHARFRDHTMQIFEKHGMKNVAYWTPTDKQDTLIYVIAHKSREAADASWAAFRDDPVWKKAYKASIQDGKIVKKVEREYLTTTDYSPLK